MATLAEIIPSSLKRELRNIGRQGDEEQAIQEAEQQVVDLFHGDTGLAGTLLDIRQGQDVSVPAPPTRHKDLASSPRVLAQRTANKIG
jgi:hypothetical protein